MAKLLQRFKQIFGFDKGETLIRLVGTDRFQNKFYERLPGNRYYNSTRRFYEPARYDHVRIHIDPAWEGWLRGTRKDPPTVDETMAQEARRQEFAEKSTPMLPTSYGINAAQGGNTSFPLRDSYEINPGTKTREKQNPDQMY